MYNSFWVPIDEWTINKMMPKNIRSYNYISCVVHNYLTVKLKMLGLLKIFWQSLNIINKKGNSSNYS